ncbi:MAG: alpha/beta hydrolase, partial [Mesorhizobium sp.]
VFAEPGLFDAAALMHPLIPFEPQVQGSLAGRRILITAGRRDPICPPNLTTRLEAYLRADGADVTVEWHNGG